MYHNMNIEPGEQLHTSLVKYLKLSRLRKPFDMHPFGSVCVNSNMAISSGCLDGY